MEVAQYCKVIILYVVIVSYVLLALTILVFAFWGWRSERKFGFSGAKGRKRSSRLPVDRYNRRWANLWLPRNSRDVVD